MYIYFLLSNKLCLNCLLFKLKKKDKVIFGKICNCSLAYNACT